MYPISPTAEELALFIEDRNYIKDKTTFSVKDITGFLNEWVKDNLTKSTQNTITYYRYYWLDTQLRKAASKVKILVGQIQSIPILEIGVLKHCFINFYREVDVFKKH